MKNIYRYVIQPKTMLPYYLNNIDTALDAVIAGNDALAAGVISALKEHNIAGRVLSNKDEAQRLQSQLISQKLLAFYKETMSFKTKEVSYEDFIKEVYK